MSGWTAVIPLNLGRDCKTRLSARLTRAERDELVAAMAAHVVAQVQAVPAVSTVFILSPDRPDYAGVRWLRDLGRGLNAELVPVFAAGNVLVIHADLPLVKADDIAALITAATESGAAIAPDRTGTGTNALALTTAGPFLPLFGIGSLALHHAQLPEAAIVELSGLAVDIDTPEDLDLASNAGALPIAGPI